MVDQSEYEQLEGQLPRLIDSDLQPLVDAGASATDDPGETEWLQALGRVLQRVRGADEGAAPRDRAAATRMGGSRWTTVSRLKITPTLDGVPCGPEHSARVAWSGGHMYSTGPSSVTFRDLVRELSRPFVSDDSRTVIRDCAGRPHEWIEAYARQHLKLADEPEAAATGNPGAQGEGAPPDVVLPPSGRSLSDGTRGGGEVGESTTPGEREAADDRGRGQKQTTRHDRFLAYLQSIGHSVGVDAIVGPDGRYRRGDAPFHWTLEAGSCSTPIWIAEDSLEGGIDLPSEVWVLGQSRAAQLYLPSSEGYEALSFRDLAAGVARGTHGLFPSRYRLRLAGPPPAEPSR